MAAIDKIYIDSFEKYTIFKNWCLEQPAIKDKYGRNAYLIDYLFKYNTWEKGECLPICNNPYYIDAYLIRNCPFDFIQEELIISYGKWTQDMIDDAFDIVMRRGGEKTVSGTYHWLSEDDFTIIDGKVFLDQGETSYDQIKADKLYASPSTDKIYEIGKAFKILRQPRTRYNRPFKSKVWHISVSIPEELDLYMWYHRDTNTWDFPEEFVISEWSSSHCYKYKTIKAVKRAILKWKLPVGTIVTCQSQYIGDTYKFEII